MASDDFEIDDYTGSTGNLVWTGPWNEVNESDGPSSGDEQIRDWGGSLALRVRDNDGGGEGVEREVDLSGHTSATLSFDYWRDRLDNANDYVIVMISRNGGSLWNKLAVIEGPGTDSSWNSVSYDISAYIASNTMIGFVSSPTMGGSDSVFFDNIAITASGGTPCP